MIILDLGSSQIKTLKKLEAFPDLDKIHDLLLNSNYLREIEKVIDNIHSIRKLDLSLNSIPEIKNLENLRNLTELDLSINKISQIKGLWGLSNLKKIVFFLKHTF